jgi:hypothetical protein
MDLKTASLDSLMAEMDRFLHAPDTFDWDEEGKVWATDRWWDPDDYLHELQYWAMVRLYEQQAALIEKAG